MNCYTTEQQVAGILRLFLWEERVKYIISRALCVSRLNLTDVAFDILLVMIGCARVTQMGIQQTLKLHWYWMDFFHVIFNLTLHCFSLLTKMYLHNCLEKKKQKTKTLSSPTHSWDRYVMAQAGNPVLVFSWKPDIISVFTCFNPRKQTHFKPPSWHCFYLCFAY